MNPFETIPLVQNEREKRKQEPLLLHRGIWAETLENNQNLPVGGNMFSNELTTKLHLDFDSFEDQLRSYTPEIFRSAYEKQKESIETWMKTAHIDFDSYTFFVCQQIQQKIALLLEINGDNDVAVSSDRARMYTGEDSPKLSEMKGNTECAERAAMAQYLLQRLNITSAYVSGVTMRDISDGDEYPESHSFIILENISSEKGDLVFDIARPHPDTIPRIMRTDTAFNYDVLKDEEELLIGSSDIIPQGKKLWFGVGEPIAGKHKEGVR